MISCFGNFCGVLCSSGSSLSQVYALTDMQYKVWVQVSDMHAHLGVVFLFFCLDTNAYYVTFLSVFILAGTFSPASSEVVPSGSLDNEVRLWNANTAECAGSRDFCEFPGIFN
jgi:WD40 repeat protein